MMKKQLFIFLIVCIYNGVCVVNVAYGAGKELMKLYAIINDVKINTTDDLRKIDELHINGRNKEIKYQMDKIHEKLEEMDESISSKIIHHSMELPLSKILLYKCLDEFEIVILNIDKYYNEFRQCLGEGNYSSNPALQHLTHQIHCNIEEEISAIRTLLNDAKKYLPHDKNLISAITSYANTVRALTCSIPRMIPSLLVDIFKIIIIAEIKASVMLAFTNIYKFAVDENFKQLNSKMRDQFVLQFEEYVNLFKSNLELIDGMFLRACDPADGIWIRNKSFYEIEGVIQTTIFRYHWFACKYDACNTVYFDKPQTCEPTEYDVRSSCLSTIAECAYLNSIEACVLEKGPKKFQYVKSKKLGELGRNLTCPKDDAYIIKDGTGWNSVFSACACNCYGNHNRISLATIQSKVNANRVIVGLRFLRKSDILYIQPKEAKLAGNGHILQNTQKWVAIPHDIEASKIQRINRTNRVFFLDDLRLPSGYALIGVKFNKAKRRSVTGFSIEIFGLPFNYANGELSTKEEDLISIQPPNNFLGEELLFERISSAYTRSLHTVNPENPGYVSLKRSTLKDDFGQSTLPLFDAVPIQSRYSSVLSGIGIFHKSVDGYSGLIALRVYGLRYTDYFSSFEAVHIIHGGKLFNESYFNG